MEVPILKQGHYLIASIQSALTDADLSQLREALIERVGRFRARGVIVDVTALDVMDSFAVRTLRDIAHMARLRGAETVIVGIQPDVAFAMVHGEQLGQAWGPLLVLFVVGLVLTSTRVVTRSVTPGLLIHVGYNLMLFGVLYIGTDHFRHLERMTQ